MLSVIFMTLSCSPTDPDQAVNARSEPSQFRLAFAVTDFSIGPNRLAFGMIESGIGPIKNKSLMLLVPTQIVDPTMSHDNVAYPGRHIELRTEMRIHTVIESISITAPTMWYKTITLAAEYLSQ